MALILVQALPDLPGPDVMQEVLRIRPKAWPNLRIIEMGDRLLGRAGEITTAAISVYRLQLEIRPHLAEFMMLGGRGRKVSAARQSGPVLRRTHHIEVVNRTGIVVD